MKNNNLILVLLAAIAAAVMTASAAVSPNAAVLLALLSPLPLYVSGFMAGPIAALLSGLGASVLLWLGFSAGAGIQFFLYSGLAPILLSHLCLRHRPIGDGPTLEGEVREQGQEWYPEGRLLAWGAGLCFMLMSGRYYLADGASMQDAMRALLYSAFQSELEIVDEATRQNFQEFANRLARLTPALGAHFMVLSLFVNFRLAAMISKMSGKALRPWAAMSAMVIPRETNYALAIFTALALVPGEIGNLGQLGLACVFAAFAMGGLAIVHRFIDQMSAGPVLYFVLYLSLSLFYPLVALVLAVLALVDPYLNLRKNLNFPKE